MKLGLAFSGGKDSLACWYLCRDQNPTVFWVNTGKAYPETIAIVEAVRSEAHAFVEVKTDQQANIAAHGVPADIVPIDWTDVGMIVTAPKAAKVQSYLGCCYANVSAPLHRAAKDHGITHIIRGQRADESHRATSVNGTVYDGMTFLHPVEDWSAAQVMAFLKIQMAALPDHYRIEHSSLDCYDCTAYMAHSRDRVAWMRDKHPALYAGYANNMNTLRAALAPSLAALENVDA